MELSIGKQRTLTPRGTQTPELISIKLEIYDYTQNPSPHKKIGGGVALRGWSGQIGNLSHLWFLFFPFLPSSITPTGCIS